MANKPTTQTFAPLGRGIDFAREEDGTVYLRINADRATGVPSASGKMVLTAQTLGGWTTIPGTDVRMNLQAGFSSKAKA